jgi:hypothetical protein
MPTSMETPFTWANGNVQFSGVIRNLSKRRRPVIMTPQLREEMGEKVVQAIKAVGYWNVGTLEFLVDEKLKFLFHGNEHARSGRASGYGTYYWYRYRARPDSHRSRSQTAL